MSWDLLFLRLLAPGAVTAGGTEEPPELAHHVREGRIVGWHGRPGDALGQRVQHDGDVWCGVRGHGVLLPSHHLLLTGDLSLYGKLCPAVSQVSSLRCGGD